MISLPMTEDQFAKAEAAITNSDQVSDLTKTDHTSGSFKTPQVDLSYDYIGGVMQVTVNAKHGVAKFASENTIKQHLQELLQQV